MGHRPDSTLYHRNIVFGMLTVGMTNQQVAQHFQACEFMMSSLRTKFRRTVSFKSLHHTDTPRYPTRKETLTMWRHPDVIGFLAAQDYRFLLCFRACLFIDALWSPAEKGLTSRLSFVMSNCEVVTFPLVSWDRCGAWLYWFFFLLWYGIPRELEFVTKQFKVVYTTTLTSPIRSCPFNP